MSWGGARAGAGRPAKGPIASEPHKTRPELSGTRPVYVRSRLVTGVRAVARRRAYQAIRRAVARSLARDDFRIVQLALRAMTIELVVEAADKTALARGMQGFQVSAARSLNRVARRTGTVFPDRYRMTVLGSRGELRAVLDMLGHMEAVASPETRLARQLWTRARPRRWMRTRADEDS